MKNITKELVALVAVALLAIVVLRTQKPVKPVVKVSVAPTAAATQLAEADTGEGKLKVIGTSQKMKDGSIKYTFKVVELQTGKQWPLFEKTTEPGVSMEIPFNSWSPDDKQLFLQINNPGQVDYYVFKVDGSLYSDGQKYLDVAGYWLKGQYTNRLKMVSGWAGPDLLVVFTTKADGSDGPLFWFVTSSRKFMQLAH